MAADIKFEHMNVSGILNMDAAKAKVPGGWFVVLFGNPFFYPDPEHKWNGRSL